MLPLFFEIQKILMTFTDKIPKDEDCGILEVTKSKSVAGADGRPVLYSESSC